MFAYYCLFGWIVLLVGFFVCCLLFAGLKRWLVCFELFVSVVVGYCICLYLIL